MAVELAISDMPGPAVGTPALGVRLAGRRPDLVAFGHRVADPREIPAPINEPHVAFFAKTARLEGGFTAFTPRLRGIDFVAVQVERFEEHDGFDFDTAVVPDLALRAPSVNRPGFHAAANVRRMFLGRMDHEQNGEAQY
ncbi:MAG: hypothetical protein KDA32_13330 [Phycisphaerales bacterium]|nr:hypothetical protein [Phycisphaerales bacterium]